MAISFAHDIRPLFREDDVDCMKAFGVELDSPAWMCDAANAQSVYDSVANGSMPPGEPWPTDKIALLKSWIEAGRPA